MTPVSDFSMIPHVWLFSMTPVSDFFHDTGVRLFLWFPVSDFLVWHPCLIFFHDTGVRLFSMIPHVWLFFLWPRCQSFFFCDHVSYIFLWFSVLNTNLTSLSSLSLHDLRGIHQNIRLSNWLFNAEIWFINKCMILIITKYFLPFYGFKYTYLIQIICTQLYDFKYSYLVEIICTHLYGFKYSYPIQIICTQFYGFKYSYLI